MERDRKKNPWTSATAALVVLAVIGAAIVVGNGRIGRSPNPRTDSPTPIGYQTTQKQAQILPNHLTLRKDADVVRADILNRRWSKALDDSRQLSRTWAKYKEARRDRGYGGMMKVRDLDNSIPRLIKAVKDRNFIKSRDLVNQVRIQIGTRS